MSLRLLVFAFKTRRENMCISFTCKFFQEEKRRLYISDLPLQSNLCDEFDMLYVS